MTENVFNKIRDFTEEFYPEFHGGIHSTYLSLLDGTATYRNDPAHDAKGLLKQIQRSATESSSKPELVIIGTLCGVLHSLPPQSGEAKLDASTLGNVIDSVISNCPLQETPRERLRIALLSFLMDLLGISNEAVAAADLTTPQLYVEWCNPAEIYSEYDEGRRYMPIHEAATFLSHQRKNCQLYLDERECQVRIRHVDSGKKTIKQSSEPVSFKKIRTPQRILLALILLAKHNPDLLAYDSIRRFVRRDMNEGNELRGETARRTLSELNGTLGSIFKPHIEADSTRMRYQWVQPLAYCWIRRFEASSELIDLESAFSQKIADDVDDYI